MQANYINNNDSYADCGVTEEMFPYIGKCCSKKSDSTYGDTYKGLCPCCSIWVSLPNGANLAVASIFECSVYGYGKRKE